MADPITPRGRSRVGTGKSPLTPADTKKLWATYLSCGSYSETGRLTGHPESTVRMAIKRHLGDLAGRREAHAKALEEAEMESRELMGALRKKVSTAIKKTNEVDELRQLSTVIHEGARVASTLRLNEAKLNGTLIEKSQSQVTVTAPLTIFSPEEKEPE